MAKSRKSGVSLSARNQQSLNNNFLQFYLEAIKQSHSKVKFIEYKKFETQPYILSELFSNEEVKLLFSLRSRMTSVKKNFSTKFKQNISCIFGCNFEENQKHIIECEYILNKLEDKTILTEVEYSDLFETIDQQIKITKIYTEAFKIREAFIEENT